MLAGTLMIAGLSASTAAVAQEEEKFLSASGTAAFVTDYRFRGVSYSDLDPAVQGGITLTTAPGLFVSVWGSSIADFNGSTVEMDWTAGWSGEIAGINTSAGVIYYTYPGGHDTDVVELFGTVGVPLGPVTATFGVNWAPDQENLATSSRYAFGQLTAAIPETPFTLKAILGNERGALVVDDSGTKTNKWDWQIGADATWEALTFGVAYVGNNLTNETFPGGRYNRSAQETVVFSVTASF
jgi:uncharacterized protein (TIGR02001 family)